MVKVLRHCLDLFFSLIKTTSLSFLHLHWALGWALLNCFSALVLSYSTGSLQWDHLQLQLPKPHTDLCSLLPHTNLPTAHTSLVLYYHNNNIQRSAAVFLGIVSISVRLSDLILTLGNMHWYRCNLFAKAT